MFLGIFIYVLLLICCICFSVVADKLNRKAFLIVIIVILTFISGFRGYDVGIDTSGYADMFRLLSVGNISNVYGLEYQFEILCIILLKICNSPTFLLLLFALITNGFMIVRLWDFREIASFPWMMVAYFISYYFQSMNIMRQFCAIAIIFFATRYLSKKKYITYLIFVLVALLFHNSALLGVLFLLLEFLQWRYINKKQRIFISLMLIALPFMISYIINELSSYSHYFSQSSPNIGLMLIMKIGLFIISGIGLRAVVSSNHKNLPVKDVFYQVGSIQIYYFLGILFTGIGYFFNHMDRIGLIFLVFESVYMGIIVNNGKYRVFYRFCIGFLLSFLFISSLLSNGQGQLPYTFVWQ